MAYERKIPSLFDSDGSSNDGSDDDSSAFTVATVLASRGRPSDSSRRDTITRTMPTISIHDKYAIPTTVQKKQIDHHKQEERMELRVSTSLMDNSSDSENDTDELRRGSDGDADLSGINSENSCREGIFRSPTQDDQIEVSSTKSTTVRRNTAAIDTSKQTNLLDIEVDYEVGIDTSSKQTKHTNPIHSSDTFMSVYEEIAAKRITFSNTQTKKEDIDFTGRGTQVKTLVTTALKSVADGLAASNSCDGVGSWDVEELQLSGKKRAIDIDERSKDDNRQRNRRKSLNIRGELTLMQDAVYEKREECVILKQKLEESQSQIQVLQNENSVVVQSKVILESKFELAREARQVAETNSSTIRAEADAANARAESLSGQLRDSQSEVGGLRLDLHQKNDEVDMVKERLQQAESELKRTKQEKKNAERERDSLKPRAELQNEIDKMRNALKDIRRLESVRSKKTHRTEVELQDARDALARVNSAAAETESTLASLRGAMEELKKDNVSLRARSKQHETPAGKTPQQWKMEWEAQEEGIEVEQLNELATPNTTNLKHINTLGAEDVTNSSQLSDHVSKLPLKAILLRTPDSSSRLLTFTKSLFPADKENHQTMNARQSVCSLCYHRPRPNGVINSCQCGRDNCNKWAHASCLLNRKSVSSCVSHPGTPAPPLPTILCGGIWDNKNLD